MNANPATQALSSFALLLAPVLLALGLLLRSPRS